LEKVAKRICLTISHFLLYSKINFGVSMKPKIIGIVGGAGPLAGANLLERVLILSNRSYNCYRDADYPQILVNSFPFSDMLTSEKDNLLLRSELSLCLNQLRAQGAEVLAIACNTLHNFLDADQEREDLIHLPRLLSMEMGSREVPLILCTMTSRENNLHKQFFECTYPEISVQAKVDEIIDRILKGKDLQLIAKDLLALIENEAASKVILGCTELSLFAKELATSKKKIIDPLEILAQKIVEKSFKNRSYSC